MSSVPHLRIGALLAAFVLLLVACAGGPLGSPGTDETPATTDRRPSPSPARTSPASPGPREPLSVVTSTTVLADLVRQVGRERVDVSSLMPAGRDPHTFEPAPGDAAVLAGADLIVINGLGLDDWLEDLAVETAPAVPLVVLGEGLDGVEYLEGSDDEHADDHDEEEGDDNGHAYNPHLWLDVANARLYVERLAGVLAANGEDGREAYEANAADYDAALAALDDFIRQQLEGLPAENRRVVSFHDAFPYFERAYGLEIIGVVIDSPGQEPSAAELARLVDEVRDANVRAVLSEIQFSDRLARVLAEETGIAVVDELYTDSLGDPPLDGYDAVMRWNAERIVEGLR